jgi:cobalamin biosynthesis protein CobT
MKCKESYVGNKKECLDYVKSVLPKVLKGDLKIEGQKVSIPGGEELEYKVKYENDEQYKFGSLAIKISWGEEPELPEEESEDEEEDGENEENEDNEEGYEEEYKKDGGTCCNSECTCRSCRRCGHF